MTRTRIKVGAASPRDRNGKENAPGSGVASLVATVMSDLGDVFASMDWADDEIEQYNGDGRLTSVTTQSGAVTQLTYSDGTAAGGTCCTASP